MDFEPSKFTLSTADADIVVEFLRLGSQSLTELLAEYQLRLPGIGNGLIDRFLGDAADLRERIEAFLDAADSPRER